MCTSGRRGAQTNKHARKHAAVVDVHIREAVHTQRKCTCIHTQLCCCQIRPLVIVENFCARRRARADAHTVWPSELACMLQQGEAGAHTCSRMHHLGEAGEALVREGFPIPSHFHCNGARNVPFLNF